MTNVQDKELIDPRFHMFFLNQLKPNGIMFVFCLELGKLTLQEAYMTGWKVQAMNFY